MKDKIHELLRQVAAGSTGTAAPWQGADVVILKEAPAPSEGNFYPDPRFVETKYVGELSWLFEQLRDIFWKSEGYGAWKEEFFGRLGNRAASCPSDCTVKFLLSQTLHEAYLMNDEITRLGEMQHLNVTSGNQILDDIEGDAGKRSSWVMDFEDISMFYLNRGIAF